MALVTANLARSSLVRRSLVRHLITRADGLPPIAMPYTLDFLNSNWRREDGADWDNPQADVFVAPGHITYDAETNDQPTFRVLLRNVTKTISGDVRLWGYVDPYSDAPEKAAMQCLKLDGAVFAGASGYGVQNVHTGGGGGLVGIFRVVAGVVTVLQTQVAASLPDTSGVWLKVEDLGGGTVRLRGYARESGVWVLKCDINDASAAATVTTGPWWVFTNETALPVSTPQIYHANKVELTDDGALV